MKQLADKRALDEKEQKLHREIEVLNELLRKAIEQNATTAEDQNAYHQKYENLTTRYEAIVTRLNEIDGEKRYRKTLCDTLRRFVSTLESTPSPVTEFSTEAWTALVEKVTVFGKDEIQFTLRNGTEMTI